METTGVRTSPRLRAAAWMIAATVVPFAASSDDRRVVEEPCACAVGTAEAADAWILPPVYREGDVRFRVGGIGRVEAAAMRAARPQYPLAMTFLVREGEDLQYTSRVTVEIDRADGQRVMGLTTDGPMLLADVPPGGYHVTAVDDRGRMQVRDLEIRDGKHQDLSFIWPSR